MTPEDELPQAFATLTDHLRQEIGRQIEQFAADLKAAAAEDRRRSAADLAADAERRADQRVAAALAEEQARLAEAETRAREDGRQIGIEEGRFEGYEQGKADALAQARDEHLQAEQRAAEERRLTEAAAQAAAARPAGDTAADERLADAVRAIDRARSLSEILDTLASCGAREAERVGIVLAGGGRFRGWRFLGFDPAIDQPHTIEFDASDGAIIAEAARSGLPAFADAGTAAPPFTVVEPGCESAAIPLVLAGEVVGVLYAELRSERAEGRAEKALEILARHASRCLEVATAFRAARLVSARPDLASQAASQATDQRADEDAAAVRYARLLVSEIRLYHEPDIAAGRRDRDLTARLGGEISRARVLYEQRVPPEVRARGDHFHAELVRTLANGDEALVEGVRS